MIGSAVQSAAIASAYASAPEFPAWLPRAEKNADLWAAMWRRACVAQKFVDRVAALGGTWHLLVLSADWCGDAVNTLPVIAKLAELVPNLDLRVLERDEHPDLMNAHLTGKSHSIPIVMVLDDAFTEYGCWGPRPRALQEWVLTAGKHLDKTERYKEVRTWYARNKGVTTLEDVVGLLERASARRQDDRTTG